MAWEGLPAAFRLHFGRKGPHGTAAKRRLPKARPQTSSQLREGLLHYRDQLTYVVR